MARQFFCVFVAVMLLHAGVAGPAHAQDFNLERGLAITDPVVLDRLERRGLALDALLKETWSKGAVIIPGSNAALSAMPEMKLVFDNVRQKVTETEKANGAGVDIRLFDNKRLFDVNFLTAKDARFPLVGVVQRLDRTYKQPDTCGEVRLIYRLEYIRDTALGLTRSRLPMTFNLVFKAKAPADAMPCADIAKRWVAAGASTARGAALGDQLLAQNGALWLIEPRLIDRIETNFQALREPAGALPEFGGSAEYVLMVFDWYATTPVKRQFRRTAMENQIDRKQLVENPALLAQLKAYLFEPDNMRKLDAGTILLPRDYLAITASSFAPGGHARSGNRTSFGLFDDDAELTRAIAAANQPPGTLKNISSPAGFRMRIDDIGCVGCHQSRAIGGFHFMGEDTEASKKHLPQNAIFVPASAHFFGDAPRRRKVLETIAAGKAPDFARGFSLRPRKSLTRERDDNPRYNLIGTGYFNGWGAACYTHPDNDESFRYWTCAGALKCVKTHDNPRDPGLGACMASGRAATGDAAELGVVRSSAFRQDSYKRIKPVPGQPLAPPDVDIDVRKQRASSQTGGFFGGMVSWMACKRPFPAATICARQAGTDFNKCLSKHGTFKKCFNDPYTFESGLRECNKQAPCRDDYICIATADSKNGACLPPYFMMQFRVDGHPLKASQ